ncbi:MAG: prepilin-type N-terminal cleavage/methylation domain-containing protein [Aquabacterium sp.]|nr:prepilin-type N-terminal cleavage/methylation domain-containing protein [Aquabacterium sp.]
MSTCRKTLQRRRGVSLVEALVALAIMAFGMLALVGVQATMRLNSDLAKQRSEATRIATEEIEQLRSFISVPVVAGQPGVSYDEIASRTVEGYQPPGGIGNTTYRVVRTVTLVPGSPQKAVTVQVQWRDRTDVLQSVTLDSVLSGTPPNLGALLALAPRTSPATQRGGRHVTIPPEAVDQGDGSSRFVPPGSTGIAWYFNNLSGVMRACNADGESCVQGTLVSGTVRYHLTASQPDGASAENPQGPALNLAAGPNALTLASPVGASTVARCYAGHLSASELSVRSGVSYYCVVIPAQVTGWGGRLNVQPVDVTDAAVAFGTSATGYRSCRYTADMPSDADPNADFTVNEDHPKTYCMEKPGTPTAEVPCTGRRVTGNLINQNFLVIPGNRSCPTEEGGTDPLVNGNTRQHQP